MTLVNYRRVWQLGGTYFFTLTLQDRSSTALADHIELLRAAIAEVKGKMPFITHAICVLPDHLHLLISLPNDDDDFVNRIRLIKFHFTRQLNSNTNVVHNPWQKSYWEHLIRNQDDFSNHLNYIHFNPVKHGLVTKASDWPHSTIHRYIEKGTLPKDWGLTEDVEVNAAQYD